MTIATQAETTIKKVTGDILVVGRATDCHLIFADQSLSRRHITIRLKDGACYVEDHGSSNGTFVNGVPLKPHTPEKLKPEDQITLGEAAMHLSVSITAPGGKGRRDPPSETIITSTDVSRLEQRQAAPAPPAKPEGQNEAYAHADVVLQEAQRKAALMVQEAEMQAERWVEETHRRTSEKLAATDEACRRRMNEAFRDSEKIYQKSQTDSVVIIEAARHAAADIRTQAESFANDMRRRSEAECLSILEEAQHTSRDLKEQRLLEAEDQIKQKEDELLAATRETIAQKTASFEDEMAKEASRRRSELQIDLDSRRARLELENLSLIESIEMLKVEIDKLAQLKEQAKTDLVAAESLLKKRNEECQSLATQIESLSKAATSLDQEVKVLSVEVPKLAKSQEALVKLNEEIRDAGARVKAAEAQAEAEMLQVRVRLEENKVRLEKEESARFDSLKLQNARRARELEMQMLTEIDDKKDRMSREIALVVETYLKNNPDLNRQGMSGLQGEISRLLRKQIVTATAEGGAKAKTSSVAEIKRRERWATATIGLIMGCIVALGGRHIIDELEVSSSPLQRRVAAAQDARKLELEKRKFNPTLTDDFKGSYVDNVLYTRDFAQLYGSENFKNKFMKSLTVYMLKTFKTDEDKVIQLIGISSALVKVLNEKRANIHPDFEAQALEKMHQDESEATIRMRALLGSQIRLEAFKKFEKDFYEKFNVTR